jgi:DNA repair exonuclease SbcCD ATPase subunit
MTPSTPANVGETGDSFTPLSVEEARALMTDALTDLDRNTLLAERAEAEAQLRAAEATLGITPTAPNGDGAAEQEQDGAVQNTLDVDSANGAVTLDVVELRRAANAARMADDALARAASEAASRPPSGEAHLGTAESAFARALEIRDELPAAWRRLVGALISATGMAIVIGALGWNTYWLLVPIALIAILTIDLRLAGKAAREASAEAPEGTGEFERIRRQRAELAEAEGRLATARADRDVAYARFEELAPGRRPSEVEEVIAEYEAEQTARAEAQAQAAAQAEAEAQAQAAAQAEAEAAAQADAEAAAEAEAEAEAEAQAATLAEAEAAAQADAEAAAEAEAEAEAEAQAATLAEAEATAMGPVESAVEQVEPAVEPVEPAVEPVEPAVEPVEPAVEQVEPAVTAAEPALEVAASASEWWFGSKEAPAPPPAASAPVRALAERLSAEGRDALARIEAQLAALDRIELARKSLEWHEDNGSGEPADASQEKN